MLSYIIPEKQVKIKTRIIHLTGFCISKSKLKSFGENVLYRNHSNPIPTPEYIGQGFPCQFVSEELALLNFSSSR
jgi:hypothetical protein